MDTTLDLLFDLKQKNIRLWVDDDKLRYDAPKGALTPELGALLRQHKADLMDFLRTTAQTPSTTIQSVDRTAPLPLSFAQERLWFLDQLEEGSAVYNLSEAWRLEGPLQVAALEQSLQTLVDRHESLRTTFIEVEGVPRQVIHTDLPVALPIIDLRAYEAAAQQAEVERLTLDEAMRPFDLRRDAMLRATLLRIDPQRVDPQRVDPQRVDPQRVDPQSPSVEAAYIFLLTFHHIATDGWSMGILLRELATLYAAFAKGQPSPLANLQLQYADFAVWQRAYLQGDVLAKQLGYWQTQLAGAPELLQLPTDRPRPAQQSFRGDAVPLILDAELTAQLRTLSQQQGTTLYMTLLAAFQVLMARYSGQDDIVVGSPIANRNRHEIEPIVGFFVNTLALRTDLSGNPSFVELLAQVQAMLLAAYDHQDIPFERLVEALQLTRNLHHNPLFQVMFALQTAQAGGLNLPGLTVTQAFAIVQTTKFDMDMHLREEDKHIEGYCIFRTDLFDKATIQRMVGHFEILLRAIVAQPEQAVGQLPLLTAAEYHQIVHQRNNTAVDYGEPQTIHVLFERQAEQTPAAVAIIFEDEQLTYQELNRRANQLAHHLIELGVQAGTLVAVAMDRSVDIIVALIAILKAGGAYVPIDPAYPAQRIHYLLTDSAAPILLTQSYLSLAKGRSYRPKHVLEVDRVAALLSEQSIDNPRTQTAAEDLAYVLYTSGSTGQPKGVMITHQNLFNLLQWTQKILQLVPTDRMLARTSFSFDVSIRELLAPLVAGASLVLITSEQQRDLPQLLILMKRHQVSVAHFTPTIWTSILNVIEPTQKLLNLRILMSGGEALTLSLAKRISQISAGVLFNGYGPTETTISVGLQPITADMLAIPIAPPAPNNRFYILDKSLRLVPLGISGELYIGGVQLAKGYLDRPELTAERFIMHLEFGRLYKTGDLCRWRPDGVIEYLGRTDFQVKIRGFRIELEEIENALLAQTGVRQTVVVVHEKTQGDKRLVAYVVGEVEVNDLRQTLAQSLPDYMVPVAFVLLNAMPLDPNGKLDRKALPTPDYADGQTGFVKPRNALEQQLADIWQNVLRIDQVGAYDNFFALGGHSLLATQIISRVRAQLNLDIPLKFLFQAPQLTEFAQIISQACNEQIPPQEALIPSVSRSSLLPLSYAQERLWFFEQLVDVESVYNIPIALRLQGSLDIDALERTLQEIVRRHENLRTTFVSATEQMRSGDTELGQPIQVIQPLTFTLPVVGLETADPQGEAAEVYRLANEEAQTPFALAHEPSFRAKLLRLSNGDHVLLLIFHHIVFDGWSTGILFYELSTLYRAYSCGESSPLPALPLQYADYAVWQRRWLNDRVMAEQIAYWQAQLAGLPALLPLPTDYPRPAVQSYQGAVYEAHLPADLIARVTQLSAATETTPFMILLAAYSLLLGRYSGQSDIAVGTPIANRNRVEIEPLIGFFVNTLVMRTDLSGDPDVRTLLARIRQTTLDAYRYQDLPFEKLVEVLRPERSRNHAPLIQVLFQFANTPKSAIDLPGLTVEEVDLDYAYAHFDLTLAIQPETVGTDAGTDTGMVCDWNYNTELFDRATIARMMGHFQTLLTGLVDWGLDQVARPIGELPLLTATEQSELLVDWNAPAATYAEQTHCFHHRFEAQVEQTPDAVAVLFDAEWQSGKVAAWQSGDSATCLTYAELNARANQVAHALQALGIGPETIVGLCVERSLEWTIGFLGILKAGGAYMPIDPTYPPARLAFLLADATPAVILTQSQHTALFPAAIPVVCFDRDSTMLTQQSAANPVSGAQPDNLAYVIYTSGSTGQPKGVLNEHRGLANLAQAQVDIFGLRPDSRLLQVVSLNFDVSISDLVTTWSAGATVVLAPPAMPLAPENLVPLLNKLEITHFGMVPTLMAIMDPQTVPNLQTVMVGGEACPPELVRRWSKAYRFLNLYGPTEVSICTTIMDYSGYQPSALNQSPPIGTAVADKQLYILDAHLQPVPTGIPGELYIGGPGLARGYLNRPELTAAAFIDNPFGSGRLYKTGDLVRRLPAHNGHVPAIEFLGRIDEQVKIRGFRIEIGEIEALLNEHPRVEAAVVITRDEGADKHLVAYYVARGETDAAVLRSYLKQTLPDYMIPAFFVQLDAFPRTANDKVDRKALPAPDAGQRSTTLVAPRDALEHQVVAIWQRVLGNPAVSIHDNFFEIGGQSMLAVQLIARLKQTLGREIPVAMLFQAPTIAELAAALRAQPSSMTGPSTASSLVAIQPQGIRPPLFCLPGAGGNVFGFYALANHLGSDQPLYGLQTRGLDGESKPYTTIEAMAAEYVAAIRTVQPHGPYHLVGHSLGGLIAFEMAQQLTQAGEAVAPLAILDMIAPPLAPAVTDGMDEAQWLVEFAAHVSVMAEKPVRLPSTALVRLPAEEQMLLLKSALEAADLLPGGSDLMQVRGMIAVFKANQQLAYCPASPQPVPLRLLQAAEQSADREIERAKMGRQSTAWGWEAYAAGTVEVVTVPGNHFTMLTEPHTRALAEALSDID